jgi:hypothetical protein
VVLTSGVKGLADRLAQGCRIQRHLGNERRTTAGRGLDRSPQCLAVAHQLVEIGCTAWDLSDRPVTDSGAEGADIHLLKEVAKCRIRRWPPQLKPKCLGQHAVVADGEPLQIPQALATAHNPQHRHQEQAPGRDTNPTPHTDIRDRLQKADQVEIGWGRSGFRHREGAVPPTSPHAGRPGQDACDTL